MPTPAHHRIQLHIGGQWRDAGNGGTFVKTEPWSGAAMATVAAGDADDARAAVDAAREAFPDWARTAPGQRQQILLRAAQLLEERRSDIADLLTRETGCTAHFAGVELDYTTSLLRQCAALPYACLGTTIPSEDPAVTAAAARRPVGVIAAIAPWNASLTLSGRAIAGPLALGNTVVLKPSEEAPLTGGTLWAQIFTEAGLPPGVLNVLTHGAGGAGAIGETLLAHPAVRRINFTGSTATGRRLAESAGRHLKRVVLQLSGHNPLLVLAGADLDAAVPAAAYGAFVHQGQVCMCARRILVDRAVADEFIPAFAAKAAQLPTGDPRDPQTVIGPLINPWALSLIERRVAEAVAGGARVLTGGTPQGPCYPATVLTDVPDDCELALEETFGPVAIVEVVDDVDAAVARANGSGLGLAAGVFAADVDTGLALAHRLEAGMIHVNDQPVNDEPHMPFGGVKDSGWGRFGVGFAVEEFTELQWISSRREPRTYPF